MSTTDSEDPRAKFRVLPSPTPTEELVTEEAIEPVPDEIVHSKQRSHLRLVTEAGG